jgi:allantoinase
VLAVLHRKGWHEMTDRWRAEWPNGARIAVVFQVVLEQWEGNSLGRSSHVPVLPEDLLAAGEPDLLTASLQRYGEVGFGRITELLDRYGVVATGAVSGLACTRFPDAVRAFAKGPIAREICAHSWAQNIRSFRLSESEMRENVRRSIEAIKAATGVAPVGWVSPGGQRSIDTLRILMDEGFSYHTDTADTDSAYIIEDEQSRRLVAMSIPWEVNDASMFVQTHHAPSAYIELFRRGFEVLYREGGALIGAVAHSMTFGRPFGVSAYEDVIKFIQSYPDVWITTRREIAEWCLSGKAGVPVVSPP